MKIPLMPKGVEHVKSVRLAANVPRVKIPLMPKGVEHTEFVTQFADGIQVKIPLIPKGVEHGGPTPLSPHTWG